MKTGVVVLLAGLSGLLAWSFSRPPEIRFAKHEIDLDASETCTLADIDGDGKLDIVSGENWYEAPEWSKHRFRTLEFSSGYIDNFSDLALDVNGDGRTDIVSCSWFGKRLAWWENPGGKGEWKSHDIATGFPIEFCFLVDLDNDGKARELLPQFGDPKAPLAWFAWNGNGWARREASAMSYGHGIGAGDVNGDGRTDILTPKGWLEAPADVRAGNWRMHLDWEAPGHLGFLYVQDVDGDGRRDVVTSMAHDYGIYWLRRTDSGQWEKNLIDDSWSQSHAMTLADLNGDGKPDLVTGKRYMAHNGKDPGGREPLGVYWYEPARADGKGLWVKHVIDYSTRAGGGMQIPVADVDGDGDLDIVVAGKGGLFLFENLTKEK